MEQKDRPSYYVTLEFITGLYLINLGLWLLRELDIKKKLKIVI